MKVIRSGVTRVVVLAGPYAIKVPNCGLVDGVPHHRSRLYCFVEGWLCNQSEWKQRTRPDVARPLLTVGHVAVVYPRADAVGHESIVGPWDALKRFRPDGLWWGGDESKASSWGRFGDRFLIIDYANPIADQTFVGRLFYERWAPRLVDADPAWRGLRGWWRRRIADASSWPLGPRHLKRPFQKCRPPGRGRQRSRAGAATTSRSRGNSPW